MTKNLCLSIENGKIRKINYFTTYKFSESCYTIQKYPPIEMLNHVYAKQFRLKIKPQLRTKCYTGHFHINFSRFSNISLCLFVLNSIFCSYTILNLFVTNHSLCVLHESIYIFMNYIILFHSH